MYLSVVTLYCTFYCRILVMSMKNPRTRSKHLLISLHWVMPFLPFEVVTFMPLKNFSFVWMTCTNFHSLSLPLPSFLSFFVVFLCVCVKSGMSMYIDIYEHVDSVEFVTYNSCVVYCCFIGIVTCKLARIICFRRDIRFLRRSDPFFVTLNLSKTIAKKLREK